MRLTFPKSFGPKPLTRPATPTNEGKAHMDQAEKNVTLVRNRQVIDNGLLFSVDAMSIIKLRE